MLCKTVGDLRKALEGVPDDLEVMVRANDDLSNSMLAAGTFEFSVDPGCTEINSFIIDADTEVLSRHGDDDE